MLVDLDLTFSQGDSRGVENGEPARRSNTVIVPPSREFHIAGEDCQSHQSCEDNTDHDAFDIVVQRRDKLCIGAQIKVRDLLKIR